MKQFFRETLKVDGIPGGLLSIETSGQFLDLNSHVHSIVTDGLFHEGKYFKMPRYGYGGKLYLQGLWEKAIAKYVIEKGFITREAMSKMLKWTHTGFSVYTDTVVEFNRQNEKSVEQMGHIIRYITKAPVSLNRMTFKEKTVLLKGEFHPGHKQNFVAFTPSDFLAAYTSHIPNHRQKYVNYYGVYSNRTRGAKSTDEIYDMGGEGRAIDAEEHASQKTYKKTWAMLLNKIFEVDPLLCPKCGSRMVVTSVISDSQSIRETLSAMNMWSESWSSQEGTDRGPPEVTQSVSVEVNGDIESVPFDDGWGSYVG